MALERIQLPVSLTGIDTKTDQRLAVKLLDLQNAVFTKGGQSLQKRNGYKALGQSILGTTQTLQGGEAFAALNNELLVINAGTLYSYLPAQDGVLSKGGISSSIVSSQNITRNSAEQTQPTAAVLNGLSLWAWTDSRGGVRCSLIDEASGTKVLNDVLVSANGTQPKALAVGSNLQLYYLDVVAGNTSLKVALIANNAVSTPLTLASNDVVTSAARYDVTTSGTNAIVTWNAISGFAKVGYVTQAGVIGSPTVGLPNIVSMDFPGTNCLTVVVNPQTGTINIAGHNSTTGLKARALRPDLSNSFATVILDSTTQVNNVTGTLLGTQISFFYEVNAAVAANHFIKMVTLSPTGTVGTPSTLIKSVGLASKAFVRNGHAFVTTVFDSTLQSSYFVVREDGFIEAKLLSQVAGSQGIILPAVIETTPGVFTVPNAIKTKFVSDSGTTYTFKGVNRTILDFTSARRYSSVQLGQNLHFVGGYLGAYDGTSVSELGFHLYPEGITASPATTGGAMADGAYQYSVVYEWQDGAGQIHRSANSIPQSVTVAGGAGAGKVTLTIPTLRLTAKLTPPTLAVYRTAASGTVFYKVSSTTTPLLNDQTADSVTFVDLAADSTILANELLYTTGNVLENISPGACSLIATLKNRLYVSGLEDPNTVWYSKEVQVNEGVQMSDLLTSRVDPTGGGITALGGMDDKVIVFKPNSVFFWSGQGPDDAGNQNDFTLPQLVSSDAGCSNPNSIVLYANGLLFQSSKGIYELDRSLRVSYVGAPVEKYNTANVVSVNLIPNTNQIRFIIDADPGCLLFDYFFNQWGTFTNHQGADSIVDNGVFYLLKTNGQVWKESPGFYQDVNLPIRRKITTAWIKVNGIQGFARIHRILVLGDYKSKHLLRISVAADYQQSPNQFFTFDASKVLDSNVYGQGSTYGSDNPYGGVSDSVYQFRCHLQQQKCQSIQLTVEDLYSEGSPGEASLISDITLEVSVKKGTAKLKASKST